MRESTGTPANVAGVLPRLEQDEPTSPKKRVAAVIPQEKGTGKFGSPLNMYSTAPYNNAGMEPPDEAYARNKQWAKAPGPNGYVTQLAQDQEARFQEWAHKPENWDYVRGDMGPTPGYDIRGWFQAMEAGDPRAKKDPKTHHFNDYWKTPYSGEGFGRESKYGTPDGPYWTGNDQSGWSSITPDGRQVLAPWKPTQTNSTSPKLNKENDNGGEMDSSQ